MNTAAALADAINARASIDSVIANLQPEQGGPVVVVEQGENLTSLIAANAAGTTYRLKPEFVGQVTVSKPCTIEHHDLDTLPPGQIDDMAVLPSLANQLTLDAPCTLRGVGVDGVAAQKHNVLVMAVNGAGGHLFDRVRIMGSALGQRHGMICNVPNVGMVDSTITNIWYEDETKALLCERDTNRLQLERCLLQAGAIPFLAGGATIHSPWRIPKNLRFIDCEFSRPAEWFGVGGGKGNKCKNWFELKAAVGVDVIRATFKHNWAAGQNGMGIVLSVRNQNGGDLFATIEDVLFDDCTADGTAGLLGIMGRDDNLLVPPGPTGAVSRSDAMRRVRFRKLRASNVGSQWSIPGNTPPPLITLTMGSFDVCIEDVQATLGTGTLNACVQFDHPSFVHGRLVAKQWDIPEGKYGVTHAGNGWTPNGADPQWKRFGGALIPFLASAPLRGTQTLDYFAGDRTWENITLRRPSNSGGNWQYPAGTTVIPA